MSPAVSNPLDEGKTNMVIKILVYSLSLHRLAWRTPARANQFSFIPEVFTTRAHLSISETMNPAN